MAGVALATAGCSNTDDGSSKLSNMFFFNSAEAPAVSRGPTEALYCPQVDIIDGGAHMAVGGGQASITEIARECHIREDGSVLIKVGVSGRVVPGSGRGGRYAVPVHIRVKAGGKVVAQRSQSATASFSEDQAGEFAVVQDGMIVPAANVENFDIEVGLGGRIRTAK